MIPAIDRLQRLSAGRSDVISLSGGLPDESLFPRTALSVAFAAALRTGEALQYGWPEGHAELRRFIAARLSIRGAHVDPADVIVTSGAQQALSIVATLLLQPGSVVDVGARAYPAALDLFRARGATLLDGASGPGSVALHYVMPGVSNPDGRDLDPIARARALSSGAAIVADEAYAELRFDGALPALFLEDARDRTWHVGTFSKTLCPGLRIGFLVPPPDRRADALATKQEADLQAGSLSQCVLFELLSSEPYDARLARARERYRHRCEALQRAVGRWLPGVRPTRPEGGFSTFVETGEPGDDTELLALAIARGVSFDPGRLFTPVTPRTLSFRLCHSAAALESLDEGVRRLSLALSDYRRWRDRPRRAA